MKRDVIKRGLRVARRMESAAKLVPSLDQVKDTAARLRVILKRRNALETLAVIALGLIDEELSDQLCRCPR